jgi:hypothetical protein
MVRSFLTFTSSLAYFISDPNEYLTAATLQWCQQQLAQLQQEELQV